jgi:tetratricopeptide (TPR) repeat protein
LHNNKNQPKLEILFTQQSFGELSDEIYLLAKYFNKKWISFLDYSVETDSNFIVKIMKVEDKKILRKNNMNELKKIGLNENEASIFIEFFNTLNICLDKLIESFKSRNLEVAEKCSYFILFIFGYIALSSHFSNKINTALENTELLDRSVAIKLLFTFFKKDPHRSFLGDASFYAGYAAFREDASFVIKFLWQSWEIVKINLSFKNYIEMLAAVFSSGGNQQNPDDVRKELLSLNIVMSSIFIIFWSALPRYYVTLDNDESINRFIDEAVKIDGDNPLILIIDSFRKMDEQFLEAWQNIQKALLLLNTEAQFGAYGVYQSVGYFCLGLICQRRYDYKMAEHYFNRALGFSIPEFLRGVIILNRGKNRLDDENFLGAKNDFLESLKYPHIEAPAHTNLGKLYYAQNLMDKAENELKKALEIDPSLAVAYYNLGVLYNENDDNKRARKYFELAVQIDGKLSEAKRALEEIKEPVKAIIDWWSWWFHEKSTPKKIVGTLIISLISILFIFAVYTIVNGFREEFLNSFFYIIILLFAFLVLPTLTKLKFGIVELEMKSVGSTAE